MKYAIRFFASFLLVAMFVTTTCIQAQETFTVKITGYSAKGYSISPAMAQQLTTQVVAPIQSALKRSPGSEISVSIAGYADKSGTADGNDNWGADRAQGIYNFLVTRVPKEATFGPYSVGSTGLDERAAIITVTITRATPVVPQKKSNSGMIELVTVIGIVIVIIIAIVGWQRASQPVQLAPPPQVVEVIPVVAKPTTSEIVSVEKDDNIYDIPIELDIKDGMWHTPFPTQADPTKVVFRKDRRDAVKAIKACMANPFYAPTIKQLIANGTIKVVQQGESS
jgi:hypothetical protein